MLSILVADDHTIVRMGLRAIIDATPDLRVAAEAGTGDEVVDLVRARTFDAAVLDLSMPGRTGLDLIHLLRTERPDLPMLVLSMHAEDQYALRVLRAGASGYLTKESAPDRLVEALRRVVAGGRYVSATVAEQLLNEVTGGTSGPPHSKLSEREFQVLCRLASGETVSEIADALALSVKTVSTYRSRVLEKLHLRTNADLAHYALRHQLIV